MSRRLLLSILVPMVFVCLEIGLAIADAPRVIQIEECNAESDGREFCMFPYQSGEVCMCERRNDEYFCVEYTPGMDFPEDESEDEPEFENKNCFAITCIPDSHSAKGFATHGGIAVTECTIDDVLCLHNGNDSCWATELICTQDDNEQYYLRYSGWCETCCGGRCCDGYCNDGVCEESEPESVESGCSGGPAPFNASLFLALMAILGLGRKKWLSRGKGN